MRFGFNAIDLKVLAAPHDLLSNQKRPSELIWGRQKNTFRNKFDTNLQPIASPPLPYPPLAHFYDVCVTQLIQILFGVRRTVRVAASKSDKTNDFKIGWWIGVV